MIEKKETEAVFVSRSIGRIYNIYDKCIVYSVATYDVEYDSNNDDHPT